MNAEIIDKIIFGGEIFVSKKLNPKLIEIVTSEDKLLIISHCNPPYEVVMGVPHQAAVGAAYICEKYRERDSDENAASYALAAVQKLKEKNIPCKAVIMAHSTYDDPNKKIDSPYCDELFEGDTKLIFECHGAGPKRKLDLELSAGKNELSKTIEFGRLLSKNFGHNYKLGIQKEAGKKTAIIIGNGSKELEGELELSANQTDSLIEAWKKEIPALHLEAKPRFRIADDKSNSVTKDGMILGHAIARAIINYRAS